MMIMQKKLGEMKEFARQISEYENQISIISQEKERLDSILKAKSNELNDAVNTINNHEYNLESMKRKMMGLEAKANEAN